MRSETWSHSIPSGLIQTESSHLIETPGGSRRALRLRAVVSNGTKSRLYRWKPGVRHPGDSSVGVPRHLPRIEVGQELLASVIEVSSGVSMAGPPGAEGTARDLSKEEASLSSSADFIEAMIVARVP